MSNRRHSLLALPVMLGLLLVGCGAAPTPARTDSAAPASAPSPASTPATDAASALVVAGSEVRVLDAAGTVVESLPYTSEPAVALAFFAELFESEPVTTEIAADGTCEGATTHASWEDGFGVVDGDILLPDGQLFLVRVTAPEIGGLRMQTPAGISIGDPIESLQSAIPEEQRKDSFESEGVRYDYVDYDAASGSWSPDDGSDAYYSGDYWGAHARGENGLVALLLAPARYVDVC